MPRFVTVAQIPPRPPAHSLVTVAGEENADHRFIEGMRWLPEQAGTDGAGVREIVTSTGATTTVASALASPLSERTNLPGVVFFGEKASTLGTIVNDDFDWAGRVRRGLGAVESYQIANELWDGPVLSQIDASYPNQSFSGEPAAASVISDRITPVGNGADDVVALFGVMEAGMASALGGRRGMIHVTPQVLVHAVANEVVRIVGSVERPRYVSTMGHEVVADAGYSGNGPGTAGEEAADATSQWVYGTGPVVVHLGPVTVKPRDAASNEAVSLNDESTPSQHEANDVIVTGWRPFVVQWDENVLLAAEVDIGSPVAEIGGAS